MLNEKWFFSWPDYIQTRHNLFMLVCTKADFFFPPKMLGNEVKNYFNSPCSAFFLDLPYFFLEILKVSKKT